MINFISYCFCLYVGNFEIDKGSYDAVGKYIWACGKIYEGTFKDGNPNGFGKMVYSKVCAKNAKKDLFEEIKV